MAASTSTMTPAYKLFALNIVVCTRHAAARNDGRSMDEQFVFTRRRAATFVCPDCAAETQQRTLVSGATGASSFAELQPGTLVNDECGHFYGIVVGPYVSPDARNHHSDAVNLMVIVATAHPADSLMAINGHYLKPLVHGSQPAAPACICGAPHALPGAASTPPVTARELAADSHHWRPVDGGFGAQRCNACLLGDYEATGLVCRGYRSYACPTQSNGHTQGSCSAQFDTQMAAQDHWRQEHLALPPAAQHPLEPGPTPADEEHALAQQALDERIGDAVAAESRLDTLQASSAAAV